VDEERCSHTEAREVKGKKWIFHLSKSESTPHSPTTVKAINLRDQTELPGPLANRGIVLCRIIVIDVLIICVSTVLHSHFSGSSLWIYRNEHIKSVVFENGSKLEQIEARAFSKTSLQFLNIPGSISFLDERYSATDRSLSSVRFELKQDCHELNQEHSVKQA
jgi:hypothetical protein